VLTLYKRKKKEVEQVVSHGLEPQPVEQTKEDEQEDEELNNATVEQIEEIATKENNEIEDLEKRLETTVDAEQRNQIMAALKPKRARLDKLIERLERADQDGAMDTSIDDSHVAPPVESVPLASTTKVEGV
jgi:tRNA U34 5-carboxymethylaminomethyl modifying GTPase MnmE/TrmE